VSTVEVRLPLNYLERSPDVRYHGGTLNLLSVRFDNLEIEGSPERMLTFAAELLSIALNQLPEKDDASPFHTIQRIIAAWYEDDGTAHSDALARVLAICAEAENGGAS
jgi:hypothetical protein